MSFSYLFDEIKQHIDLIDGTLSGDDTLIDKPYSAPSLTELIGYFWSGKYHRVVKVFRKRFKNEVERYCILFFPNSEEIEQLTHYNFK
jgi:hypothetical protein